MIGVQPIIAGNGDATSEAGADGCAVAALDGEGVADADGAPPGEIGVASGVVEQPAISSATAAVQIGTFLMIDRIRGHPIGAGRGHRDGDGSRLA